MKELRKNEREVFSGGYDIPGHRGGLCLPLEKRFLDVRLLDQRGGTDSLRNV